MHAQTGLLALGIRMYTYFTAQSMMARLVTLFAKGGTTVELAWGNSLRNLWYYENKVRRLSPDSRGLFVRSDDMRPFTIKFYRTRTTRRNRWTS